MDPGPSPSSGGPQPAVYLLSDYGTSDEFVGVVHAVLHALAPAVPVIDLSHHVPAFDVAAGSALLVRAGPYLGPGVVMAVVDPGVGTDRRAVALEVPAGGPTWLVGPDNGLLGALATSLGGVRTTVVLDPTRLGTGRPTGTFDGRDVFAPAAAHLVVGGDPGLIGTPGDAGSLIGGPDPGTRGPSVRHLAAGAEAAATVTWIDRFGNAQLDLDPETLVGIGLVPDGTARVTVEPGPVTPDVVPGPGSPPSRRSWTAGGCGPSASSVPDELGLLVDATGRVALVLDRASAALALRLAGPGVVVRITVPRPTAPGEGRAGHEPGFPP